MLIVISTDFMPQSFSSLLELLIKITVGIITYLIALIIVKSPILKHIKLIEEHIKRHKKI